MSYRLEGQKGVIYLLRKGRQMLRQTELSMAESARTRSARIRQVAGDRNTEELPLNFSLIWNNPYPVVTYLVDTAWLTAPRSLQRFYRRKWDAESNGEE